MKWFVFDGRQSNGVLKEPFFSKDFSMSQFLPYFLLSGLNDTKLPQFIKQFFFSLLHKHKNQINKKR